MSPRLIAAAVGLALAAGSIVAPAQAAPAAPIRPSRVTIAAGNGNAVFVAGDGKVYGVGNNQQGQLGHGGAAMPTPRVIAPLPTGVRATSVLGLISDTVVLGSDGAVYGIGENPAGELTGSGPSAAFRRLAGLPGGVRAVAVAGSGTFVLVLGSNHRVYGTGSNAAGELTGSGDRSTLAPLRGLPRGVTARSIAAGQDQSVVLGSDGNVYGAGYSGHGELGTVANSVSTLTPFGGMPAGLRVVGIAAGEANTVLLGANGRVYVTGRNDFGELGIGSSDSDPHPVPTQVPDLYDVASVAAYYETLLFLDRSGTVYGQGLNGNEQLTGTLGYLDHATTLQLASGYSAGHRIVEISVSSGQTLVRGDDGVVLGAGNNAFHEIGSGPNFVDQLTVVAGQRVMNTARPTISGKAEVGSTLHARAGTWSVRADIYSVQWFRGSAAIAHATSWAYRVVKADRGHSLRVRVTGKRAGFTSGAATSAATVRIS